MLFLAPVSFIFLSSHTYIFITIMNLRAPTGQEVKYFFSGSLGLMSAPLCVRCLHMYVCLFSRQASCMLMFMWWWCVCVSVCVFL